MVKRTKEETKEYNKKYREANKEILDKKRKEYNEKNKDIIKERRKKYSEDNKQKIAEENKKWRDANKEILKAKKQEYIKTIDKEAKKKYLRNYRITNKDKIKQKKKDKYVKIKDIILEKAKIYRNNNKDKIIKKSKNYYEKNKEIISKKHKIWVQNNKELLQTMWHKYYEKNKDKIREKIKCRSCKLFQTRKTTNYLCSYCNPDKSTRQKTKELKVKTFLEENEFTFIYNKKCNLDKSCQTYYPDFLIDCNTFFIIIECDENAHSSYLIECENIRENNICYALGLPCVFIRYNPDKKGIKIKTKQKVLKSYIELYKNKNICDNIVEYLFY